jgi:hypothetical protein
MQEVGQINPVLAVAVAADDLSPPAFDRADASRIFVAGTGQPTPVVGAVKESGMQGNAQIAVKNDRLGAGPFRETNRELGVIDKQGVDSDDNGVAGGADAVGHDHGLPAA